MWYNLPVISEPLPRISLFPFLLAGLVIAGAVVLNLAGPRDSTESARVTQLSGLVIQAREAYVRENWPETQRYAGQAVALDPSHVTARLILGLALMNMNYLDQAEAEFRAVITLAKEDSNSLAWAHNDLGVVYQRRGQLNRAEQEYQAAVDLDPSNAQARSNLTAVRRH